MSKLHASFKNAGKKVGIEIWRIETSSGTVFKFNWDIHFWLGKDTTQDASGAAAILTVNLDYYQFNGAAIQHRETQGYESKQFLDYFLPAIRYLDGGHASGFSHVTVNAWTEEKRMYDIKGKGNVRVRQVEPSIKSHQHHKGRGQVNIIVMSEVHQSFKNAGKKAGIEIWRIENFLPVPMPRETYGKFYCGDSYIVLKTSGTGPKFNWDIHFWLGKDTTQDESGAAAILTVNLDDYQFNGAAIQHRETQGYESKQFMDYFPPAIRYLDGGHASGFSHVTAGTEKRLFHIKGKKHVRVRQVEASIKSMNKGDCYILDVDHTIFVYVGERASHMEKLKANSVANHIRDQDHNGRGHIEIIDSYSSGDDTDKFFAALGSGSIDTVPDEKEGGDDEEFEQAAKEPTLTEISDQTGTMKLTELPKPLKKTQLDTKECYILDSGSTGIYVWVGRQSNEKEKSEAMKKAEEYLKANNLPSWVHVSKVPEELEPIVFKQYFSDWK